MSKSVLNVGQCVPDTATLENYLHGEFDVTIDAAATKTDALAAMNDKKFDLVLINRKLDADYTDGLDIIKEMQLDDSLKQVPVMLVTNFAESQEEAVEAGAVYGFGKLEYSEGKTKERLAAILG